MSFPWVAKVNTRTVRTRSGARLPLWRLRRKSLRLFVFLALSGATSVLDAPVAKAADTRLPQEVAGAGFVTAGTASITERTANALTIQQVSQKAILNWQTFHVGRDASVTFNQPSSSASALNRILATDNKPSEILGSITANGQIYLINQNGIIFGKGAKVDVHTLVASALDITDERFLDGLLLDGSSKVPASFVWNGDKNGIKFEETLIRIDNGAQLRTDSGGSVMIFAPQVVNDGTISTPDGQTILAAGSKIYLWFSDDPKLRGLLVEVDSYQGSGAGGSAAPGNTVTNDKLGQVIAERGNVTFAAYTVNQLGRVSATTSVRTNGSIRLLARDTASSSNQPDTTGAHKLLAGSRLGELTLGENSVTEILPELDDQTTAVGTQKFNPSTIEMSGKIIHLEKNSLVAAAGGDVTLATHVLPDTDPTISTLPTDDSRILLEPGATIDVSGTQEYAVPMDRNFIEIQVLGDELKDSPLQRNGFLYRRLVWVDIRRRNSLISNMDAHVALVGKTVGELTATGGTVTLKSLGAVLAREGSVVNVSGGSLRYSDGYGQTTQLRGIDGKVYDIGDAPADLLYTGFANSYTQASKKWGVTRTWNILGNATTNRFYQGYAEGRNAGSVTFNAPVLVLDGTLQGHSGAADAYQRDKSTLPLSGQLIIGNSASNSSDPNYKVPDILLTPDKETLLTPDLDLATTDLLPAWKQQLTLSANALREGGFGRVALYSNGRITLREDTVLETVPGGSLSLTGGALTIDGRIVAPAGDIKLETKQSIYNTNTAIAALSRLDVGANALISARGLWVNDAPGGIAAAPAGPALIDGGTISIASTADVSLAPGSILDVSGGGWFTSSKSLRAGKGGSIAISTNPSNSPQDRQLSVLELGAELRGYSLSQGGKLTIDASRVRIGGAAGSDPAELLHLSESFFEQGGFAQYTVKGRDGVTLAAGTQVHPVAVNLVPDASYINRKSGADIFSFTQRALLPPAQRQPVNLALEAKSSYFGNLLIDTGSALRTEAGGTITLTAGKQLTVNGTLEAPAGKITLSTIVPTDFDPGQSIWLGSAARLVSTGAVQLQPSVYGQRTGEVLDGGEISLTANGGYIVTEAGSVMDVSGISAVLDVLQPASGGSSVYRSTTVAGDAGSISLTAREGMLLDGTLRGAPGPGGSARGAALTITMTKPVEKNNFPSSPRRIIVQTAGSSVPAGLHPGESIETLAVANNPAVSRYNGRAFVNADSISSGGFDRLTLSAYDRIEFAQSTNLNLRESLVLDAPVLAASSGAQINVSAAYLGLGNDSSDARYQVPQASASGDAVFNAQAQWIDLRGHVGLQGIGEFTLQSQGDIRLIANLSRQTGSLTSSGNLTWRANQIYPATHSQYTVAIQNNPRGTVTVLPGQGASPVLSAGGQLTISAPVIDNQGVLKAPFGSIALTAGERLQLADGSVTSVSGEGLIVPYGHTELNGIDYIYQATDGIQSLLSLPPEKRVSLSAPDIAVAHGATLNLAGGGDLYAYEFIPGPGGSKDVLAPANTNGAYAILPWLKTPFAPYDPQAYLGVTGLTPGNSVYLSGVDGLPAGTYTLMPARYALLPGAYLVTPVSGYQDLAAGQVLRRPDGSAIVSGYRTEASLGGVIRDARSSGFMVSTGAIVRSRSEYLDTYASQYFAGLAAAQLPGDAGALSVAAAHTLELDGSLSTSHVAGARGAEVDITATKLAVVTTGTTDIGTDFVTLDANSLSNLNAESLLLGGGRRHTDQGVEVTAGANEVVIANDAASAVTAPEILVVAKDTLTVRSGSVLQAEGDAPSRPSDLLLGRAANPAAGDPGVVGDGALLRLSAGAQVGVTRANVQRRLGTLEVQSGAQLRAAQSIILDATAALRSQGLVDVTHGALSLGAPQVSLGDVPAGTPGLVFTNADLTRYEGLESLALRSYSSLDLYGGPSLTLKNLSLETPQISGHLNAGQTVTLTATGELSLSNPTGVAASGAPQGSGILNINANRITLGKGTYAIKGFDQTTLSAGREITAQGQGELKVAGALTLQAPRLTGATGADLRIQALDDGNASAPRYYALTVLRSSMTPADLPAVSALGAHLDLIGKNIASAGLIDLPSGQVTLQALGADAADDVSLSAGSAINANGINKVYGDRVVPTPGGAVTLASDHGSVRIDNGAGVNVSGADGADAGMLTLRAAAGEALIAGDVQGASRPTADNPAPRQGMFTLETDTLADFSDLNRRLNAGGFTEARDLRLGHGDAVIAADDRINAHEFRLVTDTGDIDVHGKIIASGAEGGRVELWSGKNLYLRGGAAIDASATGADRNGGYVLLATREATGGSASPGRQTLESGAMIDVSGTDKTLGADGKPGRADKGEVLLRAARDANGVAIDSLAANIVGAKNVVAEAYKSYPASTVDDALMASIQNETDIYMNSAATTAQSAALKAQLGAAGAAFHFRPGVEVDSSGDLTLASAWDLSAWRYHNEPGVLTLRASGNLKLNGSLSDGFIPNPNEPVNYDDNGYPIPLPDLLQSGDSWSYRLVAGADLGFADAQGLRALSQLAAGAGSVTLSSDKLVRTGTGFIHIAAGRDVVMQNDKSVIYTAGVPAADIADFTPPQIDGVQAVYPEHGGEIRIQAQGNIQGAPSDQLVTDWLFRGGSLKSNGTLDSPTTWYPRFDLFRQGIGALGGGNISLRAGGNIDNVSAVIPTNGRLAGALNTVPDPAKLVVDGGGDLDVQAGGDIKSGLFYVAQGHGRLVAGGSVTSGRSVKPPSNVTIPLHTLLALGEGSFDVQTGRDLQLETVFNPTAVIQASGNTSNGIRSYFYTYGPDSAVRATALTGNIELANSRDAIKYVNSSRFGSSNNETNEFFIYPSTLRAVSFSGDIQTSQFFIMFPAPQGQLELLAGDSVSIGAPINMSDLAPDILPSVLKPDASYAVTILNKLVNAQAGFQFHSDPPLHQYDIEPVRIVAQAGDITASQLNLPKPVFLEAGRDISNVSVYVQNLRDSDVTRFLAGRDIFFKINRDPQTGILTDNLSTMEISGPGRVEAIAGRNVDLGNSIGLVTRGNVNNPYLPENGANIVVLAGAGQSPDYAGFAAKYLEDGSADTARAYRAELIAYMQHLAGAEGMNEDQALQAFKALAPDLQTPFLRQIFFSELKRTGRDAAQSGSEHFGDYTRGQQAIATLFPSAGNGTAPYRGDVNLFLSQIKTEQGGNIDILVPGGRIYAGLTNIPQKNIHQRDGTDKPVDIKSPDRLGVVTVKGGDVRAFVNGDFLVNQSRVFTLQGGGILIWSSEGNIDAGKGAKTANATPPPLLKFNTNTGVVELDLTQSISGGGIGVLLANPGIVPGDVDLIAPKGEVNAGDAGIRAQGNLNIAALRVVGADNIQVSGASIGVPVADTGGVGAGLAGVGDIAATTSKVAEDATRGLGAQANERQGFLGVEVLGFGE